jgi:hypothetical protein
MGFEKAQEVVDAVSTFQRSTNYLNLRSRWEGDFDLYRLKPYNAGAGYYSYTSNSPRVIADKGISILMGAKLLIRIPEELLTDEERRISSNVERFIYGGLNSNDERSFYAPDEKTLRELKAWYSIIRGSWAERIYVHKGEDGKTKLEIKVWDIYNVAYGSDCKGMDWAAYVYKVKPQQAALDYPDKFKNVSGAETVTRIDYWDREKNIIIIDGQEVYRNVHKLSYCPVFIFRVNPTPVVYQQNWQYTDSIAGESILASDRNLFPILNKTLSDLLTIVRRGVKVPVGYWSADGSKTINEDIWQVEKAASVPLKTGEVIAPLLTQTMPADAMNLVNIAVGEVQRGAWSHTTYGDVSTRLSGYAINQLNEAMATVILPFVQAVEQSYLVDSLELVKQFSKSSLPAVEVRGRNSRNQAFGYKKPVGIKPVELIGTWHPEVRLEMSLPKDEPSHYEMARYAREGEIPLLSDQTIRSELLGIQDNDLEDAIIDREWADKQIINRMYDAYMQYVAEENYPKATNVLAALRQVMSQQAATQGKKSGTPAGFSSRTLPPEAAGGTPPATVNAVAPPEVGEV